MTAAPDWLSLLTKREAAELVELLDHPLWVPASLPQIQALTSPADILGYGGAAGGGKTDLVLGAALTGHERSIVYRREAVQLDGVEDRAAEIIGAAGRFSRSRRTWTFDGGQSLRFGSVQRPDDWRKYQGRPFDLVAFDEAANFLEHQVRMLMTWNRTTRPGQRCRVILAFNPPTGADGMWIIDFFAPWLDRTHPDPAGPGELRWFINQGGKDIEVPGPDPVEVDGTTLRPKSRTFVPARVEDNSFLAGTDYMATLDMLPEPLRSAFRHGDFSAMRADDAFQVIPTDWVVAAQARWTETGGRGRPMDALGVDVARGGRDKTILVARHGPWFAAADVYPGSATPNGPAVAGLALARARDGAPIQLDVVGVGAAVFDHLAEAGIHVVPINGASRATGTDRSGRLTFANRRAQLWWALRDGLDPAADAGLALPPDRELLADLTAPRWRLSSAGILVEAKPDLIRRIGRSPDKGDAVVYAHLATPKANGGGQLTFAGAAALPQFAGAAALPQFAGPYTPYPED